MGKTGTSGVKISAKALISKEINWFYERYIQYSIPGHHLSGGLGLNGYPFFIFDVIQID